MESLETTARTVYKTALGIFVITIVIGILNGMDIWEPDHNALLTHVHAGTLGWITLSVIGAALLMFGARSGDAGSTASARRMAMLAMIAAGLYVIAFFSGTGIQRPIAGTLMLIAIVWALVWVSKRFGDTDRTIPRLGMLLAVISLTIGAVLGVLLGLFIARGSIPGLSTDAAQSLAGAHPPAMLIGYLILAGVAITDWLLGGRDAVSGRIVVWALFTSGILVNISFIFAIDPLIQLASMLEVVAIVLYIVHMWPQIKPSTWSEGPEANFARMSVVFLAIGIALLVYVVQLFVSGELDPETATGPVGVLLAFDHSMFIGVMTNALFAAIARLAPGPGNRLVIWGVNSGLAVFLIGLVTDTAVLKRIGAPIMGLALLYGIWHFFTQLRAAPAPA